MRIRQLLSRTSLAAWLITSALSLSAAVQDDDKLHPDPRCPGVGVALAGVSQAQLDEAVKLHPRSATAYLARGNGHLADSDLEKALSDFNKAIELDPRCTRAYFGRYYVFCDGHHTDEALAALKKAGEIGPADLSMDALNLQANFHRNMKNYPQAFEEYTRVIKANLFSQRRLSYVYCQRGIVSDRLGKIQAAIADYTNAVKLDHDMGVAYLYRANDYRDQGDFKRAKADYDFVASRIEGLPPEKVAQGMEAARKPLYNFRSVFYTRIKRPDLAKADLKSLYRVEREEIDDTLFRSR